jgi:hypothetical protein
MQADLHVGTSLAGKRLVRDPEKHALGLDPMGGNRFSEKIMHQRKIWALIRLNLIGSRSRACPGKVETGFPKRTCDNKEI